MITGASEGEVNSAHHQAADKIGKGLVAGAFSADGVVEALERKSDEAKPFLMLVQWHPERMLKQENALASKIKSSFLENVFLKVS
jgi:putative glutamine amidotransferase